MQKFLNWLERVLTPLAKIIGENKYLIAIRDGFFDFHAIINCWFFFLITGELSNS